MARHPSPTAIAAMIHGLIAGANYPMKPFLDEDFLLSNEVARRLYHEYAATQPIFDYHCHLPVKDLAADRCFANLFEIWLEGDHYKWRAMRANGVPERYCTGDATPYDKFLAWARTVPYTLRNPLYHWTHLELRRYFGISELLDESSAESIWQRANAELPQLRARNILEKFRVQVVCTTDDPVDDLRNHRVLSKSKLSTRVFPAFRPDRAFAIHGQEFKPWVEQLSQAADVEIRSLNSFLKALAKRHEEFHALGCRLSDHGLDYCFATPCTERAAALIFSKALRRKPVSREEYVRFASFMMLFFARLDAEKGWTKQLHLGALRNVNNPARRTLGQDSGFDAIGDFSQAGPLADYLDLLSRENALPKMIVYNLNPADNILFATLAGCFQSGDQPSGIQYGSAWWFLDQKDGITDQIKALSNTGLLSRFVGMVTDSRSFMSYPRHEYFRRILCNIIGEDVTNGELPNEEKLLGRLVTDICYQNAARQLQLPGI